MSVASNFSVCMKPRGLACFVAKPKPHRLMYQMTCEGQELFVIHTVARQSINRMSSGVSRTLRDTTRR